MRLRTDCLVLNYFVFGVVQFLKAIASGVEERATEKSIQVLSVASESINVSDELNLISQDRPLGVAIGNRPTL